LIKSFKNTGSEDIYHGRNTADARRLCPANLLKNAGRKLDMLDAAVKLNDLRVPPGNRLEKLSGGRSGRHSIRINQQYRICFVWTDEGAIDVEITDYH
jgi:proteic killer suppression protein